ncbi:MAG: SsrA-binding protein [Maribacter sp.]
MSFKKRIFKFLAKVNKVLLPSYTKKRLDLAKASKFQLAIVGWRYYVTTNALG